VIYLDTSWLVKLYVDEGDVAVVRRIIDGDPIVVVSDLSYVEFHSAVARRGRDGSLSARTASSLISRFRREWSDRSRVSVSHDVVARAADLVADHPLRSLDAIHLASALLVSMGAPEPLRFGAADERLLAAARAEGLVPLAEA
jgi:predicted nucleic acid-binding protein